MASTIGPLEGASAHHLRHGTLDGRDERVDGGRPFPQCPVECTGCDPAPASAGGFPSPKRPLQGGALVLASILAFLLPLLAALAGALLAGDGSLRQLVGAAGGLIMASTLIAVIAGGVRRSLSEGA
jgi:hypothetical protein